MNELSERSADEHARLREVIGEIKDAAKETRGDVSALRGAFGDLRDTILGWKGEVEARLVAHALRIEALEKAGAKLEEERGAVVKGKTDRINLAVNSVLVALVLFVLYKVTGIKAP